MILNAMKGYRKIMEKNCTKKAIDEFDDQCKKENCEAKQLKSLNNESYIGHVTWPMQKNFEKKNEKFRL